MNGGEASMELEKQELLSVIVPIYNVEAYLSRCLDSIINQTYRNLEIICVDDGSTDQSGAMADEYAKKDRRIKVIHKENGGAPSARNVAIDLAKGKYLYFILYIHKIIPFIFELKIILICSYKKESIIYIKYGWTFKRITTIKPII